MSIVISLILIFGNISFSTDQQTEEQLPVDVEIEILTDEGGAG